MTGIVFGRPGSLKLAPRATHLGSLSTESRDESTLLVSRLALSENKTAAASLLDILGEIEAGTEAGRASTAKVAQMAQAETSFHEGISEQRRDGIEWTML